MTDPAVLIVGAGPTGLNLALQLAHRGVPFRIIDKASGPGQASRAMVVQARTLEFYRQIGLAERVVAAGIRIEAAHLLESGAERVRFPLAARGGDSSPYPFTLSFPQDEHEKMLGAALAEAGHRVDWSTELTAFGETAAGVDATLQGAAGSETLSVAYLCGCDGAHSRVRASLGIDFPGGTYEQTFFVADVQATGPFIQQPDVLFGLAPHTFCIVLPIRTTGMHRLIGIVPTDGAVTSFESIRPGVEKLLGMTVETINWFATYHVHHRVADRFRQGRAFLLGDAGHIHSPAGGQGMNTGIGDAVNLGWKLAEVVQGRAASRLLDTYEPERIAFARRLVRTTDLIFQSMVDEGLRGRVVRTVLMPLVGTIGAHFESARQAAFGLVSQTRIHYRKSALSSGEAGAIYGGDRLPFVPGEAGDNFAPLANLDWQVHVYGELAPDQGAALRTLGLPVHRFAWSAMAERVGLARSALYLVRPDGYVAVAAETPDPISDLMFRFALRPSASSSQSIQ